MNQNDYAKQLEIELMKKAATLNYMTKEARQRYNTVKLAHPQIAEQALMIILRGVETGQIKMVDDLMLKNILSQLINKKQGKIIRK